MTDDALQDILPEPEPQPQPEPETAPEPLPPDPAPRQVAPPARSQQQLRTVRSPIKVDGAEYLETEDEARRAAPDSAQTPPELPSPDADDEIIRAILSGIREEEVVAAPEPKPERKPAPPPPPAVPVPPKIEVVRRKPIAELLEDAFRKAADRQPAAPPVPVAVPVAIPEPEVFDPKKVDTTDWSAEDKKNFALLEFGEQSGSEQFKDARRRFAEARKRAEDDPDAEEFVISEEQQEELRDARVMAKAQAAMESKFKAQEEELGKVRRSVKEMEMVPVLRQTEQQIRDKFLESVSQVDGDDDYVGNKFKAVGGDPAKWGGPETQIENHFLNIHLKEAMDMGKEYLRYQQGLVGLESPVLEKMAKTMYDAGLELQQTPAAIKDGKKFAFRAQLEAMRPEEKARHWTWDESEYVGVIAARVKTLANRDAKLTRDQIMKSAALIGLVPAGGNAANTPKPTIEPTPTERRPVVIPTRSNGAQPPGMEGKRPEGDAIYNEVMKFAQGS